MVLSSAPEQFYSMDVPLRYRQHTELLYFTGCQEPDAALLLYKPKGQVLPSRGSTLTRHSKTHASSSDQRESQNLTGEQVLFLRPRDPKREVWDGPMIGLEDAPSLFGIPEARAIQKMGDTVRQLLETSRSEMPVMFFDPLINREHTRLLSVGSGVEKIAGKSLDALKCFADHLKSPVPLVQPLRLFKSPSELALMKRAADIAAMAFMDAMVLTRPGRLEWDISAHMEYVFKKQGGPYTWPAFPTVVASGINSCTLHYTANASKIRDGDFLMVDAGCEHVGYCSDVSRSWPVNGVFSEAQKDIYNLVLSVQEECIDAAREPTLSSARRLDEKWSLSLDSLHHLCVHRLTSGLYDLGFFRQHANVDDVIYSGAYTKYFPHALGHYLGMDTHDTHELQKSIPLQRNMVITVEPGVYVRHDDLEAPPAFRGMGMRIEDDVLIQGDGHAPQVLTASIPRTVDAIESVMRRGSLSK